MLKVFKRFYRFLFKYKWSFLGFVVSLILLGIAESIQPYFIKLFVDAIPEQNYEQILRILLMLVGLRLFSVLANLGTYQLGDMALLKAIRDARIRVVEHIQELDFAYHVEQSTGKLISIVKRGDGAFINLHHAFNIRVWRIMIGFVVGIVMFGQIKAEIAWALVITFLLNLVITWFLIKYNIKKRKQFNKEEDKMTGIIVDNLINFETVKLFAREKWELSRLKDNYESWMKSFWGYVISFRFFELGIGVPTNISLLVILLFSLRWVMMGIMTTGDFVLVVTFTMSFFGRFWELLFSLRDIAKNYSDLEKYFDILDEEVKIKEVNQPEKLGEVKGGIVFDEVGFSYPDKSIEAIESFDLKIEPGESVAFVGRSGAGKTTLVKLLMRFYDVEQGAILLDGVNVKKLRKQELRSAVGVVPQEPVLFDETIAYNIGYGRMTGQRGIEKATQVAHLQEFVESLPKGYETKVGERGIKLSGGQKQRLAIARLMISDPEVIVFDEATSSLDSESEQKIQQAIWELAKDKTMLIIAHRLSTVMKADRIVVMEQGRIVEMGSHEELLKIPDGLYRMFWQLQIEGEEWEN